MGGGPGRFAQSFSSRPGFRGGGGGGGGGMLFCLFFSNKEIIIIITFQFETINNNHLH